ncbi:MAG: beta-lactamase family protein [Deltaproteobacteria bacterium]|nr:beta-lactamase family protein [Deltaproteobacteria bacterium]
MKQLDQQAPAPALGGFDDGYQQLAQTFARQLQSGKQVGASLCVHHRGQRVVDLWGGWADRDERKPWQADTRVVVFSVTKGFAAMALHLLADRGLLDWQAPVAEYWPGFARSGKADITVATLMNHRAGLPYLSTPLSLEDCVDAGRQPDIVDALEREAPIWTPGQGQGYHAITFGMYARELFERIAGEPMNQFLRRELFEPLDSDVWLGAPPELDPLVAKLYPPSTRMRVANMLAATVLRPSTTEARVARQFFSRQSTMREALTNPKVPRGDVRIYNSPMVRRANLAWASSTASARGVARAYLPFSQAGSHDGRRYLSAETLEPVYHRQGWSERDEVLQKPVGWSHGFLKEEPHLFSPTLESFGHAGMGGALGWCDPVRELTFGYAHNRMSWQVRCPRAVALCGALYACDALG